MESSVMNTSIKSSRLISPRWAEVFRQRLERIYQALGAEDRLVFDNFQGGHQWNGKVAYPLFDQVLRG